jgi:hypothetical protein
VRMGSSRTARRNVTPKSSCLRCYAQRCWRHGPRPQHLRARRTHALRILGSGPQQRSLRYCAVVQRSKGQPAPPFVRGTRTCWNDALMILSILVQDFISVWNMSAQVSVQQKILDQLMSVCPPLATRTVSSIVFQVLDITASTDCIHYLAFGDQLPGDMRQRIAARTMHASAQRLRPHLAHSQPDGDVPSLFACFSPPAVVETERPETLSRLAAVEKLANLSCETAAAGDLLASHECCDVPGAESSRLSRGVRSSSSSHFAARAGRTQLLVISLGIAAVWWLWTTCSQFLQ